jgi:allantoin racemase
MRLCWIHPTAASSALDPLWAKLDTAIRPLLRPDTQLEFRFLPRSGNFTRSLYAEHLNSVHMVEAALQAEAEGFDGIYLGCWNDPLWEAREVLSVPVASVGEQSMLAALAMGRRFAVVTVSAKTTVAIERDLMAYGLLDRAIARPVRSIAPESDAALLLGAVEDARRDFIPRFDAVARQCIDDGADVILAGCTYYGPLMRLAGYTSVEGTGVPVVDSTAVSIKYLEAMTDIALRTGLVKSAGLAFRAPSRDALDGARRSLSLL